MNGRQLPRVRNKIPAYSGWLHERLPALAHLPGAPAPPSSSRHAIRSRISAFATAGILLRTLIFVLVFCIDIRAKSANSAPENFTSEPTGCYHEKTFAQPCTIRNSSVYAQNLQLSDAKLILHPKTTIIIETGKEVRLLRGKLWVMAAGATKLQSVFGDLEVRPQTVAWLDKHPNQLFLRTHKGLVMVQVKGESKFYEIPQGFESILEPVKKDAKAKLRTPAAISYKEHLREMKVPFPKKSEYMQEVEEFSESWQQALQTSSNLHGNLVYDQSTLEKRRIEAAKAERAKLRQERSRYREMLLDRTNR